MGYFFCEKNFLNSAYMKILHVFCDNVLYMLAALYYCIARQGRGEYGVFPFGEVPG